ncbi:hypothetical protein [Croceicoccus hydrothermalis]|uniref:hypothetical protein n=1 Tax=Croceicoccus hydrothermalis TaxID=2867964 RepID=UPI001EFBC8CB|nr:hypothetical protein [Croceicoccus hydrothermalis]
MGKEGAHIRLKLDTEEPVALTAFVSEFVGIANQFEKFVSREFPDMKADSEIYIKEVRNGCIEADLVTFIAGGTLSAAAGAAVFALDAMDKVQIFAKFVDSLKRRVSPYFRKGGRTHDASKGDLNDWLKTTQAIANDPNGSTSLEAAVFEDGERKVRAAFKFNSSQAREAEREINEHKKELETGTAADHPRVMMRFVRPSIEKVSSHKRTGERALIESVHPKPLAVMYASDMARERIQHTLKESEINTFNLLFDVDVNVEMSRGKPTAFRIVHMHDVTDAPDEED